MWKHALLVSCLASLFFDCIAGQSAENKNAPEESKGKIGNRIVNGIKAALGDLPQQVSLRRGQSQSHFCGGTVLTPRWVLTAAHCVSSGSSGKAVDASSILVVAGDVDLKSRDKAHQWSYGEECIVHPEFNLNRLQNDIALLMTKTPFVFDPYVQAAPVVRESLVAGTECKVCGWGHTKEGGRCSSELLYVNVPLVDTDQCQDLNKNFCSILPGTICAGYIEGGRDACQGDSGGGLLCGRYLTGVVSGGDGCARPNRPGLYADVAYYVTWIERYVDLNRTYPVRATPVPQSSTMLQSTFVLLACAIGILVNL